MPFWTNRFLNWNTNDANGPGTLGKDVEARPYVGGRPAGLWSLCKQTGDATCKDQFCGEQGSDVVRGVQVPASVLFTDPSQFKLANCSVQRDMTGGLYSDALYCNG